MEAVKINGSAVVWPRFILLGVSWLIAWCLFKEVPILFLSATSGTEYCGIVCEETQSNRDGEPMCYCEPKLEICRCYSILWYINNANILRLSADLWWSNSHRRFPIGLQLPDLGALGCCSCDQYGHFYSSLPAMTVGWAGSQLPTNWT
jgi:hypothetical protein